MVRVVASMVEVSPDLGSFTLSSWSDSCARKRRGWVAGNGELPFNFHCGANHEGKPISFGVDLANDPKRCKEGCPNGVLRIPNIDHASPATPQSPNRKCRPQKQGCRAQLDTVPKSRRAVHSWLPFTLLRQHSCALEPQRTCHWDSHRLVGLFGSNANIAEVSPQLG